MRRRAAIVRAVLAAVASIVLVSSSDARAATEDFHLVAQAVTVNQDAGTATFRLDFDRTPRFFFPHGGGGDQPNAFQIEVDADSNLLDRPIGFDDIDTVVRGAEIHNGDGIPVRDRDGDGGGEAGGWGPVRALVPYDLDGSTLTFTTGLQTLGDDDGRFRYRIITTEGGAMTSEINAAIIPLPAPVWGGLALLGAAAIAASRLRARTA
jgi:hypothetical protein